MQQPSYLDDLQYIVESVDVDPQGNIHFQGEPYEGYEYPEAGAEKRLLHNLSNLLYSACYTRGGHELPAEPGVQNDEDSEAFAQALRAANASVERYDGGWTVEEIEFSGNILVHKGGYKRYTYAGDFVRERFGQGPLQRGEVVNIRALPEYGSEPETGNVFYFVFGEQLLESNNAAVARLYFNATPEGAVRLVALISGVLNRYGVPFQFKCLSRPALFTRCDSAVLYIDKRYFDYVSSLLAERYAELKTCLKAEIPMFTRALAPGIGFAENPFSAAESFGTSRCRVVAQGIVNAWKAQQLKSAWMDAVLRNIQQNFLRPEALYLNPNSKYPYHFPTFEN